VRGAKKERRKKKDIKKRNKSINKGKREKGKGKVYNTLVFRRRQFSQAAVMGDRLGTR
jgi:hypothetical protein